MDIIEEILTNERYRKIVDELDTETLQIISTDHLRALKEAKRGIEQEEPDRVDDVEYLQVMADTMQKLALKVLEERT